MKGLCVRSVRVIVTQPNVPFNVIADELLHLPTDDLLNTRLFIQLHTWPVKTVTWFACVVSGLLGWRPCRE